MSAGGEGNTTMQGAIPERLKERESLLRGTPTRSNSSSDTSSEESRHASVDTPRREKSGMDEDDDYSVSDYSSYSGMHEKEKFQLPIPTVYNRQRLHQYLIVTAILGILFVTYQKFTRSPTQISHSFITRVKAASRDHHEAYFSDLYKNKEAGPGAFPLTLQSALPSDLCSICDCHATPGFYAPSVNYASELPPRPHVKDIYPGPDSVDMNEFMRQTILDIYCARQHLDPYQALKLVRRSGSNLGEMMSWSLGGLEFGKPTIYLTTATSPNGKAGGLRPQYLRRSGRAIRTWMAQEEALVRNKHPGWQVVWIVAEDEVDIDPLVVRTLRRTGVPYIYFAYGLTRSWGNAQKNAVMQVVYALSRPEDRGGLLGPGPVYGLDDDNKMLPDLLSLLIKVDRIGIVPVGNLGADAWEAPVVDELGEIVESESLWQWRKYAFDFGGFSFNSSLLGTAVAGPMFWKHNDFAGESEFLDQIIGNIRDLEPLCGRHQVQDCHYIWHNEPLTPIEMMTDDEEIAYVKKFGADKLFQVLGFESRESDQRKADQYQQPGVDEPPESLPGDNEKVESNGGEGEEIQPEDEAGDGEQ
ncbi:RNA polymerase II subunit A C-terminal domain phosphatase [Lambiella insularis]|nr:RNA polymerase II subunit A C-terminal domain phosphatase [Lambiella insularis]